MDELLFGQKETRRSGSIQLVALVVASSVYKKVAALNPHLFPTNLCRVNTLPQKSLLPGTSIQPLDIPQYEKPKHLPHPPASFHCI